MNIRKRIYGGFNMWTKIKKAALLTILVVVVLSVSGLGLARHLNVLPNIQSQLSVPSITLIFTQVSTYLKPCEYLTVAEIMCLPLVMFLMMMSRASMIRKVS
jgi:hypothetical protein